VEELYAPEVNERFIRISTQDGRVRYASGAPLSGRFDPQSVPVPHAVPAAGLMHRSASRRGDLLIAALPATGADAQLYLVEVGVSTAASEATLSQVLMMLLIGLPVAVIIATAGGWVLVGRAFGPVERMALKAEVITEHSLSERLPVVRSGDELERLSLSLNRMISRLEDAMQSEKRFVADASHELRTPLAVLRGELEGLAQDRQLAAATRETLGSMLEEVDRLSAIVEGLLALSRLDAGEGKSAWVAVNLGRLATTTAEQMSLLAEDRQIHLVCDVASNVTVTGDEARLKQVIVNLLDNAIKYTACRGQVLLKVSREGAWGVLAVADNGIGIPAEAVPHVFQRFYRADESRSREQGGAGLGLSIVQSICMAHGAQIEVSSEPGRGSVFRVRLQALDAIGPAAALEVTQAAPTGIPAGVPSAFPRS
jgi:heavy metal sensor kinase